MKEFREMVEANDLSGVGELLADDAVFVSPVAFKPYQGKAVTAAILRGAWRVFTDFRYEREIVEGHHSALVFRAMVGEVEVNGCDFITVDDDGLITEFMVMVRPLKGANALAEAMGAQFEQILAEAAAETKA
ncbi:nuclear transport factor 2 family protein [Yimella sp. cx-51]|uniref:nuclear transport factor 2 family protein n=1 Tax=Yimella sp. cx-51 TaxID=2770551 RepID=UPI00165E5F46|nr:nuclear transport factor 2 family protein [Yimella sp. cx-51]MBC9956095.1 nuclear transport factor 2 family protein [Yimella sp. cx-51]MBD2758261.1 nuclear transport factor 2 family protein [Yimella sp. cx-573]QTH37374.1 nuclear transport factor 2 family protein [Yimella sp. cx-51]